MYSDVLHKALYPTLALKVALAKLYHPLWKKRWLAKSKVPLSVVVNTEGKEVQLHSYPEFSTKLRKLEPKVTDPYHILTNLRKGATSGLYSQLCSPQAWRDVVKEDKKLLTTSIVDDCIDKQNGDLARRIFSEEVQEIMTHLGHKESVLFVYHI